MPSTGKINLLERTDSISSKEVRHDTMQLMQLFLGESKEKFSDLKVKPSMYLQQMQMSMEERIEKLSKPAKRVQRYSDNYARKEYKDFKITPAVLVFQSFVAGKNYSATLTISNIAEVSRHLTLQADSSQVFSVSYFSKVSSRLAPGMSLTFLVRFTPALEQDYFYNLVLRTDNDYIHVPIIAIGPRPLVNFPDSLDLKETLVRIPSSKSFYVKNIGRVQAAFTMRCLKPFSVDPEKCILEAGKIGMITITIHADTVNDFFKQLYIHFETGEEIVMELTGSSKNGRIWLDCEKLHFEDTFIGLKRQQKVTLFNDCDSAIRFSWHHCQTLTEDIDKLENMQEGFRGVKVTETIRSAKLEYHGIIGEDEQEKVYSRIYNDEVNLLSTNDLLFSNKDFNIDPIEGELWPGGRCNITVTFGPDCLGECACVVYCDVTGRDTRLALNLNGYSRGPDIHFNLRSLDIGEVFLGSRQTYELVIANKGDISSSVEYLPQPLVFGGSLVCEPVCQCLEPYDVKSFMISFSTRRTGKFIEDIKFQIKKSGEEKNITLMGSVVNPKITFDSNKLDFGIVPVGFPETQCVHLVNESQVPVAFALRVPGDGVSPPLQWHTFAEATSKPALVPHCSDFTITPNTGVVEPNSSENIMITLVTNLDIKNACVLVAENKNSKLPQSVSLPIAYESRVASITCDPAELLIRFCFINYEYNYTLTLKNTSNLLGYFYIPPQKKYPAAKVAYWTDITEGLLEPGVSIVIKITVLPLSVGHVSEDVMMLKFGNSVLVPLCKIRCSAQGPNVSASLETLNFGKMALMESKTLSFELTNDSPISATFHASAEEKQQTVWLVEPSQGTLLPGESVSLSVTLTVLDPGNISTALLVAVDNSRSINIALTASAAGCGIIINPNIFPGINLGYLFSCRLYQFQLTLSNPGSRHHFIQFIAERMSVRTSSMPVNLFKFTPNKCELEGGAKTEVILEGQSNKEADVAEIFICWAIINKRGIKQNLGNILIKANFITPMVELSSNELEFEINVSPDDVQGQMAVQLLSVKSVTQLPVTMILELNSPFVILEGAGDMFTETVVSLHDRREVVFRIGFKPPVQPSLQCTTYSGSLQITFKEHPQKENIALNGKLNFPNLKISHHFLDFGCIPLDFQAHEEIVISNPTPLPVNFSFSWDPDSIVITYFETQLLEDIVGSDVADELVMDPLYENRMLPSMEDKESRMNPIPLVYMEPVPVEHNQHQIGGQSKRDLEEEEEILKLLFPAVECYFCPERPTPEFNILPDRPQEIPMISQVFDMTPMFGILGPNQSQVVNVAFRPKAMMGVAATLVCSVVGGPTENIRLSGQSAKHIFSFSTTFINFGFRSFMERCEEVIKITNLSQLPFHFQVLPTIVPFTSPNYDEVDVGKITVEPASGEVPSLSSANITVRFFPGLGGEFQQTFTVQIGYLEPVTVLVTGYGLLPQLSVNQLHVSRPRVPIGWMYEAVASLTAQRFSHLISDQLDPDPVTDDFLSQDWVYVDFSDGLPTNDDIWLAIERVIAYNLVRENTLDLNHHYRSSSKTIPQLYVPGYVLDLGSVILGTTTENTIMVENRGFIRADVHLALNVPEKKLKQEGFSFSFPNHIDLPVGRTMPLYIIIRPPIKESSKEEVVHFVLHLQVSYGAVVPIYAKALLTVPYITVEQKIVNFGTVQCGHCKKLCLLLKNCGAVEAEWSATLKHIKRRKIHNKEGIEDMPFLISKSSGIFPSKTAELLEITFFPNDEKLYETVLTLHVKHNTQKMTIRLLGQAVEPKIKISPQTVQFGAHIPYSGVIENQFTITNISPIPVKVCFPDFDKDIMEEDRILRVLTHLYQCEKLLLPLDLYNNQPTDALKQFYNTLANDAEMNKLKQTYSHDDTMKTSTPMSTGSSTMKSMMRSNSDSLLRSSIPVAAKNEELYENPLILSAAEQEENLHEMIDKLADTEWIPKDPLNLKMKTMPLPVCESHNDSVGILLVFHGAPLSDFLYWANKSASKLCLAVSSLDDMILQEAATSFKSSAVEIQNAINDAFINQALNLQALEKLEEEGSGVSYEELVERVNYLKENKPPVTEDLGKQGTKKKGGASKPATPKPGTASKPGTALAKDTSTFGNIPEHVYIELIRNRLLQMTEVGLVLESLTGFFLRTVESALKVILGCAGHISCLRFITVYNSFEQHLEWKQHIGCREDAKRSALKEKKLSEFEKMTGEQVEALSPEDRRLFESTVLADRRKNIFRAPPSPETTQVTKNQSITSGKKKIKGTSKTKSTGKKDKSGTTKSTESKKKKSKRSSLKSQSAKRSLESKKSAEEEELSRLQANFSIYHNEMEELVKLLSCWNTRTAEFENIDKKSSLFTVPKPQVKKGMKSPSVAKEVTKKAQSSDVGVCCNIVKIPHNLKTDWFDGLIKFLSKSAAFISSRKKEKEWWEVAVPVPLTLMSVTKPDLRVQNPDLEVFQLTNCRPRKEEELITHDSNRESNNFCDQKIEENGDSLPAGKNASNLDHFEYETKGEIEKSQTNSETNLLYDNRESSVGLNSVKSEQSSRESLNIENGSKDDVGTVLTSVELEPGGQHAWRVLYNSQTLSGYHQALQLEVGGWRKKYKVFLAATCDIPRVHSNPLAIFQKVHDSLSSSCISNCVYLLEERLFYFGPVFATAANKRRTNDLTAAFYFINKSTVDATVNFSFLNENFATEPAFGFTPQSLLIYPRERKVLEVFACPQTVGKFSETLIVTIVNNPEPIFIQMSCIGIKPEFEFEPRVLNFERVLLYRKEICQLSLSNKSYKPMGWKLVDLVELGPQVSFSQESGVIPALQTVSVYVYFDAQHIEVNNHIVRILVYDDQFRGEPFFSEPIVVILESVDVLVDVIFPDAKSSEIKFEKVKVGQTETHSLMLKNKGKYDVAFEIKFNNIAELGFDPQQVFTFNPKKGVLPKSGKGVNVNVSCLCKKPVHLNKGPVFKVWLVDSAPTAQPVAAIPIYVSISAFTSQYKVLPGSELDFGTMMVGNEKVETIIIQNTGNFEFTCQLMALEQMKKIQFLENDQKALSMKTKSTKTKEDSKKSKSKLGKKEPVGGAWPGITMGVFTLSCSGGTVPPGNSLTVDVKCNALDPDTYMQEIVIQTLDNPWTKKKPNVIKLIATAYLPLINFNDLGYIFQEAFSDSLDTALTDGKECILYNKEANELRFANVCVGAAPDLYLHLRNSGLVPCDVTAAPLTPAFHISPARATVLAHSDVKLRLAFQPDRIGVFKEELKLEVSLPSPLAPQVLTTTLLGEAQLPQVTITYPPDQQLQLPTTLVGEPVEDIVAFVNSGDLPCKVIIEILQDKDKSFTIYSSGPLSEQKERCLQTAWLRRGEVGNVVVLFIPHRVGSYSCELRLYIANNPYEDQTIAVQAVAYQEDVFIDGLPLISPRAQLLPLKYKLDVVNHHVDDISKFLFAMKNQSAEDWYRFKWDDHARVTFTPSAGHLPPQSTKAVWANFLSTHPRIILENEEILCRLNIIHVNEQWRKSLGWDDHQRMEKWVEEGSNPSRKKRMSCFVEEPAYEEVPASNKTLVMLVSANIDYSRVSVTPPSIDFPPTIILQAEERSLKVSNIGRVPAEFTWLMQDQAKRSVPGSLKSCYGAVSMSRERPRLQAPVATSNRTRVPNTRPATCPGKRPQPIPSSVTLYSQDDSDLLPLRAVQSVTREDSLRPDWPLTVTPKRGVIPAGQTISCVVRFMPRELATFSCNFYLEVSNEDPLSDGQSVSVVGSSMLPCCHLVVPNCTTGLNTDPRLHIKFRALGIGKPTYKRVSVVNTTDEDYSFSWREINPEPLSCFSCDTPSSRLNAAKYLDVSFSFLPKDAGTFTSEWQLTIPERQVHQVVILTGIATLPSIRLTPSFLKIPTTLIGVKSEGKVAVINNEDCALKYHVVPDSLYCGSWDQTLQIQPMKGTIAAQTQAELRVWVVGRSGGEGEFRPQVSVERLPSPLTLTVIAACYVVQPLLSYQTFSQHLQEMRCDGSENLIDIGVVEARIPLTLTFVLTNVGKATVHYQWCWSEKAVMESRLSLTAANPTGVVGPQSRQGLTLKLTPLTRVVISDLRMQLKITKGPNFVMILNGTAAQPLYRFSFSKYDFGPCLIQQSDTEFYKTNLMFSNIDEKSLLLECESESKDYLKVGLTQTAVAARSELAIPLVFLPRTCHSYSEMVRFTVDGSHHHELTVTGQGVDMDVMLADPVDKLISMEGVPVGKTKRKSIVVVNKSVLAVTPTFSLRPPVAEVSLCPAGSVKLKPGQSVTLALLFSPNKVVKNIQQELTVEFQEARQVLCSVRASSVGVHVALDRQNVSFGSTIAGSTATTKLILSNTGDLAVRYCWTVGDSVFTINPQEGYSGPGTDTTLTVTYAPRNTHDYTQCKAMCSLSDGSELVASLSGRCVEPPSPSPSNTLTLSCPVRQTTSTQIPVFNKYGQEVILKVSISGEYFSGDKELTMSPYGTCSYTLTYSPLTVTATDTTPAEVHKGVASFYFVDGSCMVYALEGTAGPPTLADTVLARLATHTPHTVSVPVTNWLNISQRFQVSWLLESSRESRPVYQVSCYLQFQVSAGQTRDLPFTITSHFPGTLTFKLTLTNESSGDYLCYAVVAEVSPCDPLRDVRLSTVVRDSVSCELNVHNPTHSPVTVSCDTDIPGLTPINTPLSVDPQQTVAVRLQYEPLWQADPTSARLELISPELGVFPYTIHTTALPHPPLPPLRLTTHLGQTITTTFTLRNPTSQLAIFTCTCPHPDFTVDSPVSVPAGASLSVLLVYQPSCLSDVTTELLATSPQAGDFLFPVIGTSKKPNPMGPYNVSSTANVTLEIKNIFKEAKTFVFSVDNPSFVIQESEAVLLPNEVKKIEVGLANEVELKFPQYPATGKLTARVTDTALSQIQWTYYLNGTFAGGSQ